MRAAIFASAIALAGSLAACGSNALKAAGEDCVSSTECGAGLLCNLSASPPVCAGSGDTLPADAPARTIDAPNETVDAARAVDARRADAREPDAAHADAREPDAAHADAREPDARAPDARAPDAPGPPKDAAIDAAASIDAP